MGNTQDQDKQAKAKAQKGLDTGYSLEEALRRVHKRQGEGIMRLGDGPMASVETVSTGIMMVDYILGGHGMPRGRIVELYGPEGGGKTTFALTLVSQIQKEGKKAFYIDAENTFDVQYATQLGVDTEDLYLSQGSDLEAEMENAETFMNAEGMGIIVVDSVAALAPHAELEGEIGDAFIGTKARAMSKYFRRIVAPAARSGVLFIFINQIREKVGVVYGNPETTPGGRGLKFHASVRMDIRPRGPVIKEGDSPVAVNTRFKVTKNKIGRPFREAQVLLRFGEGFDREDDAVNAGILAGVIKQAGSWYDFDGQHLQGRLSMIEALKAEPALFKKLQTAIRKAWA